jgi:hypothetical protein
MSLIIEDGTAKTDSESYISVADANIYHANRGNTSWADLDNSVKEQLLRKSTDYMVARYRTLWRGYRKTATQALDFPRSFCYLEPFVYGAIGAYPFLLDDNVVPNEVKNACAELALKANDGALMVDVGQTVIREKVDVIEVEYDKFSPTQTRYSQIDAMLSTLLQSTNSYEAKTVRA